MLLKNYFRPIVFSSTTKYHVTTCSQGQEKAKKICLQCDLCSYLHNTLCPVSRAIQALHIILSFFFNCRKVNFFINGLKWFPKEKVSFCMHKMVLTFRQRKTERTADCMLWNKYFELQLGNIKKANWLFCCTVIGQNKCRAQSMCKIFSLNPSKKL